MKFHLSRASWAIKGVSRPCDGWGVMCDEDGYWSVDLSSLDDLLKFVDEQGECIVEMWNGEPLLRIYDYYIE